MITYCPTCGNMLLGEEADGVGRVPCSAADTPLRSSKHSALRRFAFALQWR